MRRVLTLAVALALGAAACGDGSQEVTARDVLESTTTVAPGGEDSATTTTADEGAHPWCATWGSVREAEEPSEEDLRAVVESAPAEVRAEVGVLTGVDPAQEDVELQELAAQLDALAAVEAWSHEHCGTPHPFCVAWPAFTLMLAAGAFSDEAKGGEVPPGIRQLASVALDHAPPELAHLAPVIESALSADDLNDADERAAEAAYDANDAWVEEHCG